MTVRSTYTYAELLDLCTQNLCQAANGSPEDFAALATSIVGPNIKWNPATEDFEEFE